MRCIECGIELPKMWATDICLECSRKNVKKIFEEYPDIKKCFMDTIADMKRELEERKS